MLDTSNKIKRITRIVYAQTNKQKKKISKDNKVEHKNTKRKETKREEKSHQHKDEEISIENTNHGLWSSLGKKNTSRHVC
jgi:hypothetical protein